MQLIFTNRSHFAPGIDNPHGHACSQCSRNYSAESNKDVAIKEYLPTEFARDGFIHLSGLHQVLTPANRFYAGRDDLVALVVDAHLVSNALVWETGTGTQEYFPHLYGALGADAVLGEIPFPPEADGSFLLPPELVKRVRR